MLVYRGDCKHCNWHLECVLFSWHCIFSCVFLHSISLSLYLSLILPYFSFQKYEVEFLLQQQWYDPRLRYANQSQYEYLNAIHHHEEIWLPDTYFIMHGDFKDPIIPMHFALRIYRNGTINYLMRFGEFLSIISIYLDTNIVCVREWVSVQLINCQKCERHPQRRWDWVLTANLDRF